MSNTRQAALLQAVSAARREGLFSVDGEGRITFWSDAAAGLLGYPAAQAEGQPIAMLTPETREATLESWWQRARAGDEVRNLAALCRCGDRRTLAVLATMASVPGATPEAAPETGVAVQVFQSGVIEHLPQRLAAIVESSDDAIISKDASGIITSWNRGAESIFGYEAAEMIGRSIRVIIPADRQTEEDAVLRAVLRGDRVEHFETIRVRKDGRLVPVSLTVSPVRDSRGVVIGASKIARDISDRIAGQVERDRLLAIAQEHAALTERLSDVGKAVASTFDPEAIAQAVTDAATELTTAEVGAFFYNVVDARGEAYTLYTIAGAAREAFAHVPMPRNTPVFAPTFRGESVLRSDDITQDPRYGHNPPYQGMPPGHLPVRSYLAVPVLSRSGAALGGLFFGHSRVAQFTAGHERLAVNLATWASLALDNARLHDGLRAANRLKDEFLATLSHELRTPLNAIVGYTRMLSRGMLAAVQQGRAIDAIERNGLALTRIVEDVLDVSRIVSGKVRLDVQPVDLPRVVRDAVAAILPAATAKQIRVETILDPNATPISGDPDRLQQVTWNLLTNALKFTGKGGTVQVQLARVNSHVEICISDSGVGIAADFLPHIFEPFRQADASTRREQGGLGLGLSIARQLVEMQGGTIHASSGGLGQGATFRVQLPVMIARPDPRAGERVHPVSGAEQHDPSLPDLHHLRVLTVDDDRDALEMVRQMLQAAGAQVFTSSSADEALALLPEVRPDVLVADLGMPHVDGFDFIARVRGHADPAVRDVPAAALTAYARSQDRARALRSGFHLHLAKPIDPMELIAAVARLAHRDAPSDERA